MAIAPNVVPVELVLTPLVTVGGEPQETTEWEEKEIVSHNFVKHL